MTNDDFAQTTNDRLTTNNVGFYFDYHDGEYGWNSSSARGADTFVPFKNGGVNLIYVGKAGSDNNLDISSKYPNYQSLTVNNFLAVVGSGATVVNYSTYGHNQNNSGSGGGYITLSYNNSTGIFSVSRIDNYTWKVGMNIQSLNIYIVEGTIPTA